MSTRPRFMLGCALATAALAGCSSRNVTPIRPVEHVEVARYMGPWYVIASIPTFLEKHAYDAVESYQLRPDGRIQTTFHYRNGGFDQPLKTMHPIGSVNPGTGNAVWGMQFIWPIKAEYIIAYLDSDYRQTIVARNKRDYVWIMARTPSLPDADYQALVARVQALGYDIRKLRKVPQQAAAKN